MSDVFDPELELSQDPVAQDPVDSAPAPNTDSLETVEENDSDKKGLVDSFLSMDIYSAMLLLSLIFIFLATLNMLGVLRTYSEGFPFSGGFPWSTNI